LYEDYFVYLFIIIFGIVLLSEIFICLFFFFWLNGDGAADAWIGREILAKVFELKRIHIQFSEWIEIWIDRVDVTAKPLDKPMNTNSGIPKQKDSSKNFV
jgi:hypothetical protein